MPLIAGLVSLVVLTVLVGSPSPVEAQQNNPFIGTWKGGVSYEGQSYNTQYTFTGNGTIREYTTYPNGQLAYAGSGRFSSQGEGLAIWWSNGKEERGAVAPLGSDTFRYMITDHSDPSWIGVTVVFRRTNG
jgi:hypothetical protein